MRKRYVIEVEIKGETEKEIGYVLDRIGFQLSRNKNVVWYQVSKKTERNWDWLIIRKLKNV